jgi:hypothetical protein
MFACAVLFGACDGSLFSVFRPSNIEFAKLKVHYTKSGGWIATTQLNIYGNGVASAFVFSGAISDQVDSSAVMLDRNEQDHIARLFAAFSLYERHYAPSKIWMDADYYTVVFIYENKPDTVSVYDLHRANLPERLRKLFGELESLLERIIRG